MTTRNYVPMQQRYSRVVVLVDMDCFYCQVEEKLNPELKGQPLAVVQYNAWRGGGIIAVNYAARAKGVTRHMRGDEAKEHCPEIQLVKVPNIREKADLGKYRDAGKEVANVLQRFTPLLERASVDEAYLDITEAVNKRLDDMNAGSFMLQPLGLVNTYAVGYVGIGDYVNLITKRMNNLDGIDDHFDLEPSAFVQAHDTGDMSAVRQSDIRLLIGAAIAGEVRAAVKAETGYECSAGIAHNKILAKLACGMNKPNKQTILPLAQISKLFETLPVGKIRGLGGKFGEEICESLHIQYLGELLVFTEQDLQRKFDEKNGTWLYNICRGIDLELVTPRFYSKSIGCCKKFPGRNQITGLNTLRHWLGELANEVCDRIEKDMLENNRRAKQMVLSFIQEINGEDVSSSRSTPLNGYEQETLIKSSLDVLETHSKQFFKSGSTLVLNNPIKFLGISVGKFETIQSGQGKLQEMFANLAAKKKRETNSTNSNCEPGNEAATTSSSVIKGTQTLALDGARKPTCMQNFFLRGVDETNAASSGKANNTIFECEKEVKDNALNTTTNELPSTIGREKKTTVDKETTQTPETRSFFFNLLKKQKDTDNKNYKEPSLNDNTSNNNEWINNQENKKSDISKSFFAKILKQTSVVADTQRKVQPPATGSNSSGAKDSFKQLFDSHLYAESTESADVRLISATNPATVTTATKNNKRKYTELNYQSIPSKQTVSDNVSTTAKRIAPEESYKSNYAEYAIPELRSEFLQMIKCEICKANIPSDEHSIQLHQDHHVAMQLSQQLRNEYRTEMKEQLMLNKSTTVVASTTINKKTKKSPQKATKAVGINIKQFLKPNISKTITSTQTRAVIATTATTTMQTTGTTIMNSTIPTPTSEASAEVITILDDNVKVNSVICEECEMPIALKELQEHKDFHVAKSLQRQLNLLEVRTVSVTKKSNDAACNKRNTLNTTHSSIKSNAKPITQFFSQSNC